MSVTVSGPSGSQEVAGTDWVVDRDGILTVVDDSGADVAAYAPGQWTTVSVVPS